MASRQPHRITVHCYNVGFGDCFLLTFHYPTKKRHVLIDFGSTSAPRAFEKSANHMTAIAEDIRDKCGGKLHVVVATHRHKDHISGFATRKEGDGPGDIIRSLKPSVVIQPWTEDPKAKPSALAPVHDPGSATKNFVGALRAMHKVAEMALDAGKSGSQFFSATVKKQLSFLGDDNLANKSAVDNLMTMGRKNQYVYFGAKAGLSRILPGVKTYVLGPPTLKQSETIRKQRSKDKDEFWHFAQFWGFQAGAAARGGQLPFPKAATSPPLGSPNTRWFVNRARRIRGEQMLGLVRALDNALNNTSVILLFEVAGKRLLFPGDAQLENWLYALQTLEEQGRLDLVESVDLYKVGHHGSLNATPKSLWDKFSKRGRGLQSVMSTKAGKHGSTKAGTEVPRKKLVQALKDDSILFSTESMRKADGLSHAVVVPLV